jgi:hypothetical protein
MFGEDVRLGLCCQRLSEGLFQLLDYKGLGEVGVNAFGLEALVPNPGRDEKSFARTTKEKRCQESSGKAKQNPYLSRRSFPESPLPITL